MKGYQIVTVLLLCLILIGSVSCNPFGGSEEEANQQLVEVMRGNLAVTVNGIGNIAISEERMLSFGSSGKVEKVYIEEGDKASKGDLLAKLDTDALELALAQAKVALTKQQVAITQAQVDLETAEFNIYEAQDQYVWRDLRTAQSDVDEAQRYLDKALSNLNQATPGTPKEFQQKVVIHAQNRLDTAEDILDAMLAGTDPQEVVIKRLEVELAQQSLELAQQSLEQEQQSLKQAQKQLDEATLTAPFGGVVASVDVDEGDTISATTTIVHLVDLDTLELIVEVDEIDMPGVKLGQRAIITVDAVVGVELEGEVTFIPPEAKEKTGLVLYDVEISFDVPQDLGLRGGMSATADIVIDERSEVLLVPNQAITLDNQGNPVVMVMVNELTQERKVVIGISNGSHTEILGGLNEGDVVVVKMEG